MLFPTVTFAAFFAVVYAANTFTRTRPVLWKRTMLVASYVFYGAWNWRYCALLAGSTVVNWILGYAIKGARGSDRRLITIIVVFANLSLLGTFKYYEFLVSGVTGMWEGFGVAPVLNLAIPVGISFFTFQAMSYVIDIHRGDLEPRSFLDFAVFLSFFPQLVAGPIVRATEFLPQLDDPNRGERVNISEAAWLIGRGLIKKTVVATYLAESVVDPVFAAPSQYSKAEVLQAAYGYAIQIYADFSGYTDIAIGIALLLGFRFPTNFDNPYRALSVQEFWRRWHMTLSRWLRDYLYISLGGNRGTKLLTYRNLVLTMVLGGLWHGAAWTFVVWGLAHGVLLSIERLGGNSEPAPFGDTRSTLAAVVNGTRWFVTFNVICLTWIPFRSENFTLAGEFIRQLWVAPMSGPVNTVAVFLIVASLGAQLLPSNLGQKAMAIFSNMDLALQSAVAGVAVFLILAIGPDGVAPFIYFQF